jgi:hypothetical protein
MLTYIKSLSNEEETSYLLLDKDYENRDSLDILAKFNLYDILKSKNVYEVIMIEFKSKFCDESSVIEVQTIFYILNNCSVKSKTDFETSLRFYNRKFDVNDYK